MRLAAPKPERLGRSGLAAFAGLALATAGVSLAAPAYAATTGPSVTHACGTASTAGTMRCFALRRTDLASPATIAPNATPSGYGPTDLQSAYKLSTAGTAVTVAIVDAFDDPNAASDLATYRSQFGLPACTTANGCFSKVNQTGGSTAPPSDTGWAGEISLDVDMVSAVCPNCHILLVEATSNSNANLYAAENYAAAHAKFVSNSWGGGESSSETSDDANFNHPGVAITVSSGDDGNGAEYPATSRFVTAVGGTSLNRATSTSRGWSESAWNGAGSGCSAFETKPTFQTVTTGCTRRAEADVSAVADPNTGVAVYQTFGASGWSVYGGTSAAAPIIASVYALAGTPGASDLPAAYPYAHTGNLFDVTSGSNGTCGSPQCTAGAGWDGPTGLGTPNGTAAFTAGTTSGNTVTVTNPGSQTGTVGTAASLQITASDSGGAALTYSASGLPTGLSISSSGRISGTPSAAGTFSVSVTASDSTGASGSTSFTWTITGTGGGTCASPGQKLGNPGFESGNTVWSASANVIGQNASGGQATHGGTWNAWLDGYGTTHTDTLSQSVTLPAGCTSYTFSFFLHIDTSETTTSTAFDNLTVKAGGATLATYSNLNKATGYTQRSFSLAAFAGQTVTLTFTGTEDVSLQTSFVVDDTAVTVS